MTDSNIKAKRMRKPITDRIVLNQASMGAVTSVINQVDQAFGGLVKLGTKDVVNYLVLNRSTTLSPADLNQIRAHFFDEVRAAQWALKQVKEAKGRGENLSLGEVLAKMSLPRAKVSARKSSQKRKEKSEKDSGISDTKVVEFSNDDELKD